MLLCYSVCLLCCFVCLLCYYVFPITLSKFIFRGCGGNGPEWLLRSPISPLSAFEKPEFRKSPRQFEGGQVYFRLLATPQIKSPPGVFAIRHRAVCSPIAAVFRPLAPGAAPYYGYEALGGWPRDIQGRDSSGYGCYSTAPHIPGRCARSPPPGYDGLLTLDGDDPLAGSARSRAARSASAHAGRATACSQ
jgi:hypothetical protein